MDADHRPGHQSAQEDEFLADILCDFDDPGDVAAQEPSLTPDARLSQTSASVYIPAVPTPELEPDRRETRAPGPPARSLRLATALQATRGMMAGRRGGRRLAAGALLAAVALGAAVADGGNDQGRFQQAPRNPTRGLGQVPRAPTPSVASASTSPRRSPASPSVSRRSAPREPRASAERSATTSRPAAAPRREPPATPVQPTQRRASWRATAAAPRDHHESSPPGVSSARPSASPSPARAEFESSTTTSTRPQGGEFAGEFTP